MPATNLRIPGPIELPEHILAECSRPMISHRGSEFAEILHEITDSAKGLFGIDGDVFLLSSSGTGAMEAAVVNFFSPGDAVLVVRGGVFADRTRAMATAFGLDVDVLEVEWGDAVDPAAVARRVEAREYRGLFLTHNETSTGVMNDVEAVGGVLRGLDLLFVVDGVSSVGAIPLRMDDWRVDVAYSASQKAWTAPPGAGLLAVGSRGWKFNNDASCPRFYFDLTTMRQALKQGQCPWTPPLPVCFALRASLREMREEGLDRVFSRHHEVGEFVRRRVIESGMDLFARHEVASDTVTAIRFPPTTDAGAFMTRAREDFGTVFGGGEGELRGKIFRIGHMGWTDRSALSGAVDVAAGLLD